MGKFLYYSHSVECNILLALNKLEEQHSTPTKKNEATITHFLDYAATNLPAIIQYNSKDMILYNVSDPSYLPETRARSRTRGHY